MPDMRIGERYRLARKILGGDATRGLPELWLADDAGDTYYIKLWRKKKSEDVDLGALWNREIRGLSRLQGYPGASQLFVRLQDLGATPSHY